MKNTSSRDAEKDTMTPRERFRATVKFAKVDRYFHTEEGPWRSTCERWHREGLPSDWQEKNFFGLDEHIPTWSEINLGWCAPAYYPPLKKEIIAEEGRTNVVRDDDLIIKRELAEHPDLSMPQFLEYPVKNRHDWEKIKPLLNPYSEGRYEHLEEAIEKHANPQRSYPIWQGLEGAYMRIRNMLGDVNLAYAFYDAPDLIHDILENWVALNSEAFHRTSGKLDLDKVELSEDMCYNKGLLLSPDHLRGFFIPHYRTLFTEIRRAYPNTVISIETDGNVEELIPLMTEMGVDMFSPMEVAAGNNVVEYRNKYPNLIICGGIDKRPLAKGKDAIRRELERVLPIMWSGKGYFPMIDHTIPPNVSLENYLFYLEEVRNFSG